MRTNQHALKYIQEQKLTQGTQHKLLVKLLGYNCSMEYKQERNNKVVDALSRVQHLVRALFVSQAIPKLAKLTASYINDANAKNYKLG